MGELKWVLVVLILFFTSSIISAICENNQIDINIASIEELDELYGIGPVKSQAIIDSRSFDSIDDLIKVKGIGEVTLEKIKEQGLACVEEEIGTPDENDDEPNEETIQQENESLEEKKLNKVEELELNEVEKQNEVSVINLTKVIKTEDNNENSYKTYAVYGFIVFCILLVVLFTLRKNKFKNEFN